MHDRYQAQTFPLSRMRCWVSWRKSALYESLLFRRFDLITMASDLDVATGRHLVPEEDPPILLVPNGVDCGGFRPGLAASQVGRLVFSGALRYAANLEAMTYFLQEVYPRVRQQRPGVHLHITGSTQGADLARLRLDETVTLTGFVDDIRPEIASACVSVVPVLSGGGTRIKILEAMALGTPVVSTSKGAEGLAVTPGENILLADTAQGFAQATLRLLEDPELRARLARNARQLVQERYSWSRIGRRLCRLLEGVVARNQPAQEGTQEAGKCQ
jgi:glycosyltransferase involved in cell wall biosynthesis